VKRISVLAMLACAVLAPAVFAQQRSQQLLTNGVTVILIDNGTRLSFTNDNTSNTDIDIVVYWENGSSSLKSYNIRPFRYRAGGGFIMERGNVVSNRPTYMDTAPVYSRLDSKAVAISIPTAAQMTTLKNQRDAEARTKAERERREEAERAAERARQEETQRTAAAAENARKEALTFNASGEAAARRGDSDRAIADFTQAIRLDPNLASAYSGRGLEY
jgi:tetratricopeptide (TPR) repeat protein